MVTGLLFVLLIAGIAIAATAWIVDRPQRGILVAVALVPFDGLRLPFGIAGPLASWKEALAILTAVAAAVHGARRRRTDRPTWFLWLVGLICLAIAWSPFHRTSAMLWGLKLDFVYVTLTFAALRTPLTSRDRDRLVTILMSAGAATAVYGLAQQVIGHERLHRLGYDYNSALTFSGGFLRSVSSFALPFSFGFYLMMVILVCLPVALADLARLRNRVFIVLLPLYIGGVVVSVVRTAIVGLLIGLVYIVVRRHRLFLAVLIPVGLVAAFALPASGASSVLSASSVEARAANWSRNVTAVLASPLGIGVGETGAAKARSYGQTAAEQRAALGLDPQRTDVSVFTETLNGTGVYLPDNYFVKTLIELGVLGLWFFVRLLAGALVESRALERVPCPSDAALGIGSTAYLAASIFSMFFATYLELFPIDVHFWLLLGVVAATVRLYPVGASDMSPRSDPGRRRAIGPLGESLSRAESESGVQPASGGSAA